jgi:prepilin peptidase CpaA
MFANAVLSVYAGLLVFAALSDAARLRIPNNVPLALLALYPLHLLSIADPLIALPALGMAAIVFALGFVFFARGWMGGGDVKLLSVGALWAGPHLIGDFLIMASLVGGLQALASALRLHNFLPHWATLALASPSKSMTAGGPSQSSATSARTNTTTGTGSAQSTARRRTLPYGIAIACGGLYVAGRLAGIITL